MWLALLSSCGLVDADGAPRIEAHRCAAGYFPENSRSACDYAFQAGFEAVEFDLVVTADDVAVIHHDPFVNPHVCTTADGAPLGEEPEDRVYIRDLTAEQVQADYLCGGLPNEELPDAALVEETIMRWDELLATIAAYPDPLIHIDIKWEEGLTRETAAYVDAVMVPWWEADLPNAAYVSAEWPEMIRAVEAAATARGLDVTTSLSWPGFPDGDNTTMVAMGQEALSTFGLVDLAAVARGAQADELNVAWQLADRRRVEAAVAEGVPIQLWTLNDAALMESFSTWPVEALITDIPESAP